MSIISTISTVWNEIKKDFGGFIAEVGKAVVFLGKEAVQIQGWATKLSPELGAALALIIHAGEVGMQTLASHAASGLDGMINNLVPDVETTVANAISATGLSFANKQSLTAAEIAILNKVASTAHAAVDAALAKVVAAAAPATGLQQSAPASAPAPVTPPPPAPVAVPAPAKPYIAGQPTT